MIEGLLLGPRFSNWGWVPTSHHPRAFALDLIVEKARGAGVLDIARTHGIDPALYWTQQKGRNVMWLRTMKSDVECQTTGDTETELSKGVECKGRVLHPPSALVLLKWHSKNLAVLPLMKLPDCFVFTSVVAQSLAKLVGRALRLPLHDRYTTP